MVISLLPNCPCLPLGWLTAQPRPLPFLAILGALLGAPTQRAVTTPGSWCLGRRGPRSSAIRRGTRGRGGIPLSGDLRPFLPSGWEEAHRMVLRRNRAGGQVEATLRSLALSSPHWGSGGTSAAPSKPPGLSALDARRVGRGRVGPAVAPSVTTRPFCGLEMSSAKHVLSPHSPRPGGQRWAAGVRDRKLTKGAHPQPESLRKEEKPQGLLAAS